MKSNSKKAIASVAALQILLYHCWIPVFSYGTFLGSAERFLVAATYSGVDVFFFISAYSLVSAPVEDYKGFIINRSVKLLPFFLIALLFGRFLWFIPSIMVIYLVLPPLYRICRKRPYLSLTLILVGWVLLVYLILGVIRPSPDFGIFLFRIPSIVLGACAVRFKDKLASPKALVFGIFLFIAGMILVYKFGYLNRLNTPFRSTFYLTGIPVMLGTVIIVNRMTQNLNSRIIKNFGSMTLELYFTQMVLGTALVSSFFRLTGSRLLTNILTLTVIIVISLVLRMVPRLWKKPA